MLLGGRGRRLEQLDVGGERARSRAGLLGRARIGSETASSSPGAGRVRSIHCRRRTGLPSRPEARQHRAPAVELSLLLGAVAQAEGSRPHRQGGGVGAGGAIARSPRPRLGRRGRRASQGRSAPTGSEGSWTNSPSRMRVPALGTRGAIAALLASRCERPSAAPAGAHCSSVRPSKGKSTSAPAPPKRARADQQARCVSQQVERLPARAGRLRRGSPPGRSAAGRPRRALQRPEAVATGAAHGLLFSFRFGVEGSGAGRGGWVSPPGALPPAASEGWGAVPGVGWGVPSWRGRGGLWPPARGGWLPWLGEAAEPETTSLVAVPSRRPPAARLAFAAATGAAMAAAGPAAAPAPAAPASAPAPLGSGRAPASTAC